MKKLLVFIFLIILSSCNNDKKEIRNVVDKFIEMTKVEKLGLSDAEIMQIQVSEPSNNECEVNIAVRDRNTNQTIYNNLILKKYENGWAICRYAILSAKDKEIIYQTLPTPLGIEAMDLIITNSKTNNHNYKKESSAFLNMETLYQLSNNQPSVALNILQQVSDGWHFKGQDNQNIIWVNEKSKDEQQMVTYHKREKIWEYLFFQKKQWQVFNRIIADKNMELYSHKQTDHGYNKTFKWKDKIIQIAYTELTNSDQPVAYKVLILNQSANISHSETEEETKPSSNTDLPDARSDFQVSSERAYFHDKPTENSKRNAYLVKDEYVTVYNDDFVSEFIYVTFTNPKGQTSKGWIQRKDLEYLETEE